MTRGLASLDSCGTAQTGPAGSSVAWRADAPEGGTAWLMQPEDRHLAWRCEPCGCVLITDRYGIACLECGEFLGPLETACPACGWSYESA